ncbi:MAG: decarboxylase, partial [Planctomycetota bacterium]|nr:decarboxylase [Planctomycetota bacterium]
AFPAAERAAFVAQYFARREEFLAVAAKHGSPLYVLEPAVLRERANRFRAAFGRVFPGLGVYYAVKSNNCPEVARTFLAAGLGLDVSSGVELSMALSLGAKDIVFSGPGKVDAELDRLQRRASAAGVTVRAGVRLTTDPRGLWRKFGIVLDRLADFFTAAAACPNISLEGLQAHSSWNLDPGRQIAFLAALGKTLAGVPAADRAKIHFVDIGGGYWPEEGEWALDAATPAGQVERLLNPEGPHAPAGPFRTAATPIDEFADQIASAVATHLAPHVRCRICMEPGRWLVHRGMHLLMTVVDRKDGALVITDAGTNAVGWERFEFDYFPVLNLTRPGPVETPCHVLGCLCTPHDVWGYAYYGSDIQPGDVLLIPTQGAYTFSLRQEFIKPLPRLVTM